MLSVGVRFIRVSAAIFDCRTPCEERRPSSAVSRASSSPSTLTCTLALRRSGLVSTEVTVTKPIRGSLNSAAIAEPITSRSTWLMRRMRGVVFILLQRLLDLLGLVELEHVAVLDVGVALEHDAALLALLDLLHVA